MKKRTATRSITNEQFHNLPEALISSKPKAYTALFCQVLALKDPEYYNHAVADPDPICPLDCVSTTFANTNPDIYKFMIQKSVHASFLLKESIKSIDLEWAFSYPRDYVEVMTLFAQEKEIDTLTVPKAFIRKHPTAYEFLLKTIYPHLHPVQFLEKIDRNWAIDNPNKFREVFESTCNTLNTDASDSTSPLDIDSHALLNCFPTEIIKENPGMFEDIITIINRANTIEEDPKYTTRFLDPDAYISALIDKLKPLKVHDPKLRTAPDYVTNRRQIRGVSEKFIAAYPGKYFALIEDALKHNSPCLPDIPKWVAAAYPRDYGNMVAIAAEQQTPTETSQAWNPNKLEDIDLEWALTNPDLYINAAKILHQCYTGTPYKKGWLGAVPVEFTKRHSEKYKSLVDIVNADLTSRVPTTKHRSYLKNIPEDWAIHHPKTYIEFCLASAQKNRTTGRKKVDVHDIPQAFSQNHPFDYESMLLSLSKNESYKSFPINSINQRWALEKPEAYTAIAKNLIDRGHRLSFSIPSAFRETHPGQYAEIKKYEETTIKGYELARHNRDYFEG